MPEQPKDVNKGSWVQTAFHGGEWSQLYQGRLDHPKYKYGMNFCRNSYPIEEGAWVRRPGSRLLYPSRAGLPAQVYPYTSDSLVPYMTEWTDNVMRLWNGTNLVTTDDWSQVQTITYVDGVTAIDVVTPINWAVGDEVLFTIQAPTPSTSLLLMRQRVFQISTITPITTANAWDSSLTYTVGDTVDYLGTIYISLSVGNLDETPTVGFPWWLVSPTGSSYTFTIVDTVTGQNVNLGTIPGSLNVVAKRVFAISTHITQPGNVRIMQNGAEAIVLSPGIPPKYFQLHPGQFPATLEAANPTSNGFTIGQVVFEDGPYLDALENSGGSDQNGGSWATVSGVAGGITVQIAFAPWNATAVYNVGDYVSYTDGNSYICVGGNTDVVPTLGVVWDQVPNETAVTGVDDATGFQASDVGRLVRFYSEPLIWDPTEAYAAGAFVTYLGTYYQCVTANTGDEPDLVPLDSATLSWQIAPSGARWTWGIIVNVNTTTNVTVNVQSYPLLYSGSDNPVRTWQLGLYCPSVGYPTAGTFYQGRFWLGGPLPNRFDTSNTDGAGLLGRLVMSPTELDGTVVDSNSISYTLDGSELDQVYWFAPDRAGLLVGTYSTEWLLQASATADPITPSSIQANPASKYGCANTEPRRTGIALIFIQRFLRKAMEYLQDVFTQRYVAPHLSETCKHLTAPGFAEIWYEEELAPILWGRLQATGTATLAPSPVQLGVLPVPQTTDTQPLNAGNLIGATYRRVSAFTTEVPNFIGWHRHDLGSGRFISSMASGMDAAGTLPHLYLATTPADFPPNAATPGDWNGSAPVQWIEYFTQMFDEPDQIWDAWFLDGAMVPDGAFDTGDGLMLTGLYYLTGQTLTVFIAGLDVGLYTVDANGTITVPYGSGAPTVGEQIDYTQPGAGAWQFTAAWVEAIAALNLAPRNGGVPLSSNQNVSLTVKLCPNCAAVTEIQAFVETIGSPYDFYGCCIDWAYNGLFVRQSANTGLDQFSLLTGLESQAKTWGTFNGGNTAPLNMIVSADNAGNLYFGSGDSNYSPVVMCTPEPLTNVYVTGVESNFGPHFGGPANPPGLLTPGMVDPNTLCAITGVNTWLVAVGVEGITLMQASTGAFVAGAGLAPPYQGLAAAPWEFAYGGLTTVRAAAPALPGTTGYVATGFIVEAPGGASASPANVYVVQVNEGPNLPGAFPFFGLIGSILPAAVDSTWTVFTGISGCLVDQMDNNVLTIMQNSTAASGRQQYLVKICTAPYNIPPVFVAPDWSGSATFQLGARVTFNGQMYYSLINSNFGNEPDTSPSSWLAWTPPAQSTFGLMWAIPLPDSTILMGDVMAQGRTNDGSFAMILNETAFNSHIMQLLNVDLTTGFYGYYDINGLYRSFQPGLAAAQAWDCKTCSIVWVNASFDPGISGAIPRVNGTGAFSGQWGQLFLAADQVNLTKRLGGSTNPEVFCGYNVQLQQLTGNLPCVVGWAYPSQGQALRPIPREDTGTHFGVAFGKTRRTNRYAMQFQNMIGCQVGTDFTTMFPVFPADPAGNQYLPTQMYTGIWRDTLNAGYDYDNMLAWQVLRPYPCSIVAAGGFMETQDV